MKAQRFSLLCALVLPMAFMGSAQAQSPTNNLLNDIIYREDPSVLQVESPELANRTEAAINKLSATCQNVSSLQKLQYKKINALLENPKVPLDAKQILVDTRVSLVWGIESFRQNALQGKLNESECALGLDSLDTMDKQLDKIAKHIK